MSDTLPHNLDAEMAVLGALVLDAELYDEIDALLSPKDFYDPLNGELWSLIAGRRAVGRRVDAIVLESALKEHEGFKQLPGGASRYLAGLIADAAPDASLSEYAQIVADFSVRRQMIRLCRESLVDANTDHDRSGTDIAGALEADIARLQATGSATVQFSDTTDGMAAVFEEMERARASGGITGIRTGITALDERTAGLQRSNLVILAARPSMGKTAVAGNIAVGAARNFRVDQTGEYQKVGLFSIEMTRVQVWQRALVAEAHSLGAITSLSMLRKGYISRGDDDYFQKAKERLSGMKSLLVDESRGITVPDIRRRCRAMSRKMGGLDLVLIDYLSLISKPDFKGRNEASVLGEITWSLKNMAGEFNCPVVLLSQLNRQVEFRENKRPMLSDLRDSGSIEQDADDVFFVYRDAYYLERQIEGLKKGSDERKAAEMEMQNVYRNMELICAKQRQGPIGTDLVHYEAEFNFIRDMGGDDAR